MYKLYQVVIFGQRASRWSLLQINMLLSAVCPKATMARWPDHASLAERTLRLPRRVRQWGQCHPGPRSPDASRCVQMRPGQFQRSKPRNKMKQADDRNNRRFRRRWLVHVGLVRNGPEYQASVGHPHPHDPESWSWEIRTLMGEISFFHRSMSGTP